MHPFEVADAFLLHPKGSVDAPCEAIYRVCASAYTALNKNRNLHDVVLQGAYDWIL